jgi:hypothetical protein
MLKRTLFCSTLAGLVLLLGVSCKGGASGTPPGSQADATPTTGRASANEDDFAASMLLTLDDFPAGWVHKPGEPDTSNAPAPLAPCYDFELHGQTGEAVGGEFSDFNTTMLSINPSVYVFDSAEHAGLAADALIDQAQCLADAIGDGFDVDATFAFGPTETRPLDASAFGAVAAIRVFNTQVYKDAQPPHSDILVFDVVVIVDGRVLYRVEGFQRYLPIDQDLLKTYVDLARAKIKQEP